jgi:tRNA(His) 5'-end guanylyltransferase
MEETMLYLCQNVQGCVLGYHQSDEITLILTDYKRFNSDAWFDYEVQKMCSIAASMATMAFNRYFDEEVDEYCKEKYINSCGLRDVLSVYSIPELKKVDSALVAYLNSMNKGAMFDARCFNIPKEEVTNLVYWRQLDAARNSVQMVGQANFSHKELQGKSCNMIQDMLMTQKGINWNDFPTYLKRGSCCVRDLGGVAGWSIDLDMPMLKGDDRKYLDELIYIGE